MRGRLAHVRHCVSRSANVRRRGQSPMNNVRRTSVTGSHRDGGQPLLGQSTAVRAARPGRCRRTSGSNRQRRGASHRFRGNAHHLFQLDGFTSRAFWFFVGTNQQFEFVLAVFANVFKNRHSSSSPGSLMLRSANRLCCRSKSNFDGLVRHQFSEGTSQHPD